MHKGIPSAVTNLREITKNGNGYREIIGNINIAETPLKVKFIRPLKMASGDFTIAEIRYPYGTVLWKFSQNGFPKGCLCMLFYFKRDFVISIIKGEQIFSVIPISSLVDRKRRLSLAALRCLKKILANQIGMKVGHNFRSGSNNLHYDTWQNAPANQSQFPIPIAVGNTGDNDNGCNIHITASQPVEPPSTPHERKKRRQEALQRREEVVVTKYHSKFHGIPVTEGEWPSLPDGQWVILFLGYDIKPVGNPLGVFQVKKKGGGKCIKNRLITGGLILQPTA